MKSKGSKLYVVNVLADFDDEYFVVRADDRAQAISRATLRANERINGNIRHINVHEAKEM